MASADRLLLIDAGNSRLKWAALRGPYRRGQDFEARGALDLAALTRSPAALVRLLRALDQDAVHVCNVAGGHIERQIRAATREAGIARPQFARSERAFGAVRNGYAEPWRLGVDRWVGLIGAHFEHPRRALCIVSVGTAMTIDLLAADGRHLGGNIIPGPQLMIESLLERTAGIRRRAGGGRAAKLLGGEAAASLGHASASPFAHETRSGLISGARHACAAAIEHALESAREQLKRRPRLVLAGGAADGIASLLHAPAWRDDDLVLRGLAVLAAPAARAPSRRRRARRR